MIWKALKKIISLRIIKNWEWNNCLLINFLDKAEECWINQGFSVSPKASCQNLTWFLFISLQKTHERSDPIFHYHKK